MLLNLILNIYQYSGGGKWFSLASSQANNFPFMTFVCTYITSLGRISHCFFSFFFESIRLFPREEPKAMRRPRSRPFEGLGLRTEQHAAPRKPEHPYIHCA